MAYNFAKFGEKTKVVEEWLTKELSGIRTARATPVILDAVFVESYGAKLPVKQVASITSEDVKTLRVVPYDESQAKAIEKAITLANLGLSVSSDDKGVRVSFPDLTAERRAALAKVAKEKFEQSRVSLRKLRDEILDDIQAKEKQGGMGEDEKFRLKKELDKLVDGENKKLAEISARKEKEIMS